MLKINSFPSLDGRQGCIFRLYCMRRGYLIDLSTYIHMLEYNHLVTSYLSVKWLLDNNCFYVLK